MLARAPTGRTLPSAQLASSTFFPLWETRRQFADLATLPSRATDLDGLRKMTFRRHEVTFSPLGVALLCLASEIALHYCYV